MQWRWREHIVKEFDMLNERNCAESQRQAIALAQGN